MEGPTGKMLRCWTGPENSVAFCLRTILTMRTLIKHVLASAEAIESVTVKGWVRTRRDSKGVSFLASNRTIRVQGLSGLELADWLGHYAREGPWNWQ